MVQALLAQPWALAAVGGAAAVALLAVVGALLWRRRKRAQAAAAADAQATDDPSEPQEADEAATFDDALAQASEQADGLQASEVDASTDPLEQADTFLAYGRDKQAEDVLLQAIAEQPERLALHLKLLEIYGQQRDLPAFNAAAQLLHDISGGQGDEWNQAREAGQLLDPDNPLYQLVPAAPAPQEPDDDLGFAAAGPGSTYETDPSPAPAARPAIDHAAANEELDALLTGTRKSSSSNDLDFDLDLDQAPAPAAPAAQPASGALDIDFDLDLDEPEPPPPAPAPAPAPKASAPAALPSSVQDLSLDLELDPEPADPSPLETKLSLAQEFDAIGDTDGARSLALEVESEATGALKERARAFLAQLG